MWPQLEAIVDPPFLLSHSNLNMGAVKPKFGIWRGEVGGEEEFRGKSETLWRSLGGEMPG